MNKNVQLFTVILSYVMPIYIHFPKSSHKKAGIFFSFLSFTKECVVKYTYNILI